MTLHLGLSNSSSRNAQHQQQIKDAKRELRENLRNDWDYPALPAYQLPVRRREATRADDEDRIAGFRFHTPDHYRTSPVEDGSLPGLRFEPLEWREREYSSDESSESENSTGTGSASSKKDNYRFEGPDSVGTQIQDRRAARKRKRQKAMDEELTWNEGLAHWLARRDAWSGAHTSTQLELLEARKGERISGSTSASAGTTPRTSTSSKSSASARISSTSTTPELVPEEAVIQTRPVAPPSEILVPLAPTILANHPIRRRINSDIYPEIYSKIIVQSRNPSVPINLATLIKALVQGWKDDGEWPPKPGVVEKSIGRKKGSGESSLKSSVKAVGRVLRITGGESSVGGSKEKG